MGVRMNYQHGKLLIENTHVCGRFMDEPMLVLGLTQALGHRHKVIGEADAVWIMVRETMKNSWGRATGINCGAGGGSYQGGF